MQKVLSEVPQHDLRTLQFYFQLCAATIRHFVAVQSADLLAGGALEREREKLKVIVRLCEHFTHVVRVRVGPSVQTEGLNRVSITSC